MRFLTKLLITVLCLSLLAAVGLRYKAPGFSKQSDVTDRNDPGQGPPPATLVITARVQLGTAREQIEAVGTLLANESVMLRPEIAGRIRSLDFHEGRPVKQGEVLIVLDPAEYQAQMAQTEAQVELWQLKSGRNKALLDRKVISKQEYDEMRAALKEAEAGLALTRTRLEKTVLRAPFAGVLGLRRVSPGDYVEEGQDLVNLESIDPIKVELRVPERYAGKLRAGQTLAVQVDAYPERTFAGRIYAVDPRLDQDSRSVLLRGRIQNPKGELRPGMFGRTTLTLREHATALWMPEQALLPQGDERFVYRVVDGKALFTRVEIGLRRPGEVEIRTGLKAGDTVITDGQMKIQDGMAVRISDREGDTSSQPSS
jgi:membrane fusion protein, multidrug efflux system